MTFNNEIYDELQKYMKDHDSFSKRDISANGLLDKYDNAMGKIIEISEIIAKAEGK